LKGQEPSGKRYTRRMHQMSVTENEAARQVNTANLAQFAAVLAADEWQRAWEALAEPEDERTAAAQARGDESPMMVRCDCCAEVVPFDTVFIDGDDEVCCADCLETQAMAGEEGIGGEL
jgi:hypothetical protein